MTIGLQDGPKRVVWEGDLPGGGQRQMTRGSNSSEKQLFEQAQFIRMASWRGSVLAADATKAGSASEATCLTPRPPSLTGRLACNRVSDRSEFVMRSIANLRSRTDRGKDVTPTVSNAAGEGPWEH